MISRLAGDPRVTVRDRTNFRFADPEALGSPFDLVVVDVSFISVTLLAANLAAAGREGSHYVVLVKPQFEVGRSGVGAGGIVRDPAGHRVAVMNVGTSLAAHEIGPRGLIASPVRGTKGNQEFLLHAVKGEPAIDADILLEGVVE